MEDLKSGIMNFQSCLHFSPVVCISCTLLSVIYIITLNIRVPLNLTLVRACKIWLVSKVVEDLTLIPMLVDLQNWLVSNAYVGRPTKLTETLIPTAC